MADPASIAAVGMGSQVAGSLTQAFGNVFQGQAQAQAYQYQAGVAQMNQQISMQNANWASMAGEVTAQESGLKTRYEIGEEKSIQSGSGIRVDSGSATDVRVSQDEIGQQDQALIRSNAAHAAYGFQTEAAQEDAQANLDEMAASKSKTAGIIGGIGSILGGAASVSSKWLQGNQQGIFGGQPTAASSTSWSAS